MWAGFTRTPAPGTQDPKCTSRLDRCHAPLIIIGKRARAREKWEARELRDGIAAQLDAAGLGFVNEWASEQLEGADDVSVARPVGGLPEHLTETVQKSYAEVRALLDGLDPQGPGSWEAKVRDSKRCGLVKAVCAADGSFEWVEARWKAHYEQRGGALLELADDDLVMLE